MHCWPDRVRCTVLLSGVWVAHSALSDAPCFHSATAQHHTDYHVKHFWAFLTANNLLGLHTGLEPRDARLIFAWSSISTTDELLRRRRATTLAFLEFVEAVARLADVISPPEPEAMTRWLHTMGMGDVADAPPSGSLVYEYYTRLGSSE